MNKEFNFKIFNNDLIQTSIKAINNTNTVKNITISNNNNVISTEFGQSIATYENKHNSNPNNHLDIRKNIADGLFEERNALEEFKALQQEKNAQLEEFDNNLQSKMEENKLGDDAQTFFVAEPVEAKHAVNKEYLSSTINNLPFAPSNVITGLGHSVVGNTIAINKGFCLDNTSERIIRLDSQIKKTLSPFQIGSNKGGLDTVLYCEDFVQPTFTSNTTLGNVSSSSMYMQEAPYKALDNSKNQPSNTNFLLGGPTGWWKWILPYKINVSQINFWNNQSANRSKLVRIWANEAKTIPLTVQFDAGGEWELKSFVVNNVITNTIFVEHISANGGYSGIGEIEITAKKTPDKMYTHLISTEDNQLDVLISAAKANMNLPDGFIYSRHIGEFKVGLTDNIINPYPQTDLATAYINNIL